MESRFTLWLNASENTHFIKKKASNKNLCVFNFLQKTQWMHLSIYLRNGDRELRRLPCLKYWNGKIVSVIFKLGYINIYVSVHTMHFQCMWECEQTAAFLPHMRRWFILCVKMHYPHMYSRIVEATIFYGYMLLIIVVSISQ